MRRLLVLIAVTAAMVLALATQGIPISQDYDCRTRPRKAQKLSRQTMAIAGLFVCVLISSNLVPISTGAGESWPPSL